MKSRISTEDDFEAIRTVHYAAGEAMFKDNFLYVPLSDFKLNSRSKDKTLWVYVNEDDKVIAFNCCNKYSKDSIFIEQISVHPNCMRRGIASHLMQSLINFSKEINVKDISLTSTANVSFSFGLYKKFGFEIINKGDFCDFIKHELTEDYSNGRTDRIAMRLKL